MIGIKKVAVTPLPQNTAKVIDSFNTTDDKTTNAPSLRIVENTLNDKQPTLVSGVNIRTINNQSLLGSGNINISGGGGGTTAKAFYDTVAIMKADTELSSGDVVATKGYYSANDGGDSFYEIVDDGTLTEDGGSIIELDNGLFAQLLVMDHVLRTKQFGTQDQADISTILTNIVTYVHTVDIIDTIRFDKDATYTLNKSFYNFTKDITLDGNGCKFLLGIHCYDEKGPYKRVQLFIARNDFFRVENMTIDTDPEVDVIQWDEQIYKNINFMYVFSVYGKIMQFDKLNIYNIWGEGLIIANYYMIDIVNCTFDKIGGGYYYTDEETGAFDSFGDAMHIGGHNGDGFINIRDSYFRGVTNDTGSRKSRGGFVLENLDNTLTPEHTYVSVVNTAWVDFNRPIHVELYTGDICATFRNGLVDGDCLISAGVTNCKLIMENMVVNYSDFSYGGSYGLRGFTNALIKDSEFNMTDLTMYAINDASNGTHYMNCKFNGINDTMFMNGDALLEDCVLNIKSTAKNYLAYGAQNVNTFKRCTFNQVGSTTLKEYIYGMSVQLESCILNYITLKSKCLDLHNIINLASNPTDIQAKLTYNLFNIYVNGTLYTRPNLLKILPATLDVNTDNNVVQDSFTTEVTALTLKPSFNYQPYAKYLILLTAHSAGTNKYSFPLGDYNYYYLKINGSGVPLDVTEVKTVGDPANWGRAITFDYTNQTFSKASSGSGNANGATYFILPANYADYIGYID